MFCPKCGSQSPEDLKYCRSCGTDLGAVSQALTGKLALPGKSESRGHRGEEPRIDSAINSLFTGLAFICVSFAVLFFAPAGRIWWFWMLIPAFISLGKAIGEYMRWKERQRGRVEAQSQPQFQPPSQPPQYLSPPPVSGAYDTPRSFEAAPPPSVTEGTTRHLDAARPSDEP